jgi:dihydrofolate reductase
MKKPIISFVVAMSKQTRAIGKNNDLLWKIPRDMEHFKNVTSGHPMIMGRTTFDSIGKVLPNRTNIVITRNTEWKHKGVLVCHSLEEALHEARKLDTEEITIIGGAQIFTLALPIVTRMYLTYVDDDTEGDVYFPVFDEKQFSEITREDGEYEGIKFSICTLDKIEQTERKH